MKSWQSKTLIVLIGLFIATSVFLLGLELLNVNKVAWGIKVVGVNIGGQSPQQAQNTLAAELTSLNENKIKLVFEKENISWQPSLAELGVSFDLEQTVNSAYQIGRGKNILAGLWQQILAFFGRYNLEAAVALENGILLAYAQDNFSNIEDPAQSATLVYNENTADFDILGESKGIAIDKEKLANDLAKQTARLNFDDLDIVLKEDIPLVKKEQAEKTYDQVKILLSNAPYYFGHQDKNWPIDKEMLIDWLVFKEMADGQLLISFSQDEVEPFLITLAPEINEPYVNARLGFEDAKMIVLEESRPTKEIDIAKTTDQLSSLVLSDSIEVPVIIKQTPAPITKESLEELGIVEFVAQGVSNFRGSSYNRTTNIKIGVSKFNSLILEPNQEFMFNELLGEVTAADGYLPEMVIKEEKLVPEYGGGLCQVSTTMFRAAINSGMEITERYPHAFPVGYYNPQGFDATIYPPHPDLRFINDTPGNILIQGYTSGTKAFFEFYGQNDGRSVEVLGPYIYESNPDGSMKTVLTQQVFYNEEMTREDKFWSNYKSPSLYPVERNPLE